MAAEKGVTGILYMLYLPLAIPYMSIQLWKYTHHYLEFVTEWWFAAAMLGITILVAIVRWAGLKLQLMATPARKWECFVLGVSAWVFLWFAIRNYYEEHRIPKVAWARVTKQSPAEEHLAFLEEVRAYRVAPESMLTASDRKQLVGERRKTGFQDDNDTIAGANYRIVQSDVLQKCPIVIKVRDDFKAFVGAYIIRDRVFPNQRLTAVSSKIKMPTFPDAESEYRLVIIVFALDKATDDKIGPDSFDLGSILELKWK